MHERKHVRGRTSHVRDSAYIRSHDMPNVLFLVLIYGDIPFNVQCTCVCCIYIVYMYMYIRVYIHVHVISLIRSLAS